MFIERDTTKNDKMSIIINAVREAMSSANTQQMNVNEILKRMQKVSASQIKLKKEELMDALEYYKKLQVIYVDSDENVIFL